MTDLYAPQAYWKLSNSRRDAICNGCGLTGWKGKLIPNHLLFLSIKDACYIHDYMYHIGSCFADKEEADRVFLNNMIRIVESDSIWFLKRWRRYIAVVYYDAVKDFGGWAFWNGKNDAEYMRSELLTLNVTQNKEDGTGDAPTSPNLSTERQLGRRPTGKPASAPVHGRTWRNLADYL